MFSRNQLNKYTHGHTPRLSCQECCARRYAESNPQKKKLKAVKKVDGDLEGGSVGMGDREHTQTRSDIHLATPSPNQVSPSHTYTHTPKPPYKQQHLDPSTQYIHNPYAAPIIHDAKKFFNLHYHKPIIIYLQGKTHWRTHVKLAVRASMNCNNKVHTKIGLFIPHTHTILECLDHPAHHIVINRALNLLKHCMHIHHIHGYIEGQDYDEGMVNKLSLYVKYVVLTHTQNRVQMTLVINTHPSNKLAEARLLGLKDSLLVAGKSTWDVDFHSIFFNYFVSDKHNNNILGRDRDAYHLVYGDEYILEDLHIYPPHTHTHTPSPFACMRLHIVPFVFRQANLDAFCSIIVKIREHMQGLMGHTHTHTHTHTTHTPSPTPTLCCLELYGGIGTIGLHLLDLMHTYV
ncbi:hypothetical protein EON63_20390, partial [archaeon]